VVREWEVGALPERVCWRMPFWARSHSSSSSRSSSARAALGPQRGARCASGPPGDHVWLTSRGPLRPDLQRPRAECGGRGATSAAWGGGGGYGQSWSAILAAAATAAAAGARAVGSRPLATTAAVRGDGMAMRMGEHGAED